MIRDLCSTLFQPRRPSELMRGGGSLFNQCSAVAATLPDLSTPEDIVEVAVDCPKGDLVDTAYITTTKNRSSNSSIDSGIRESSSSASPSPTFGKDVE